MKPANLFIKDDHKNTPHQQYDPKSRERNAQNGCAEVHHVVDHDRAQDTSACVLENPGHQDGQTWGVEDEDHKGHAILHHAAHEERGQMPNTPDHAEDQTGSKWAEAIEQTR